MNFRFQKYFIIIIIVIILLLTIPQTLHCCIMDDYNQLMEQVDK